MELIEGKKYRFKKDLVELGIKKNEIATYEIPHFNVGKKTILISTKQAIEYLEEVNGGM